MSSSAANPNQRLEPPAGPVNVQRAALSESEVSLAADWALQFSSVHSRRMRWFQIGFALLAGIMIVGPQSSVELAAIGVGVLALLRLPWGWRATLAIFRTPLFWCASAWAGWLLLSLLWSEDHDHGLLEVGAFRWMYIGLGLWLIMDRRRWFVLALAAGFAIACVVQIGDWIGHAHGIKGLAWNHPPRPEGTPVRASGWWYQPAIGGTLLVGALGLHLPAAFMGRGWWRVLGMMGVALTVVGLALTGARGAWLASGALVVIASVWTVVYSGGTAAREKRWNRLGIALGAALVVVALALVAVGDKISHRVEAARSDLRRMIDQKDFNTDTGGRLLMNWWAIEMAMEHPVAGVGAGGYKAWVLENLERRGIDPAERRVIGQAHNTVLHSVATSGLVGLVLCVATFGVALWGSARMPGGAKGRAMDWGSYDAAPFFALLGLCLVSAFETLHVNSQTAAVVTFLMALSMWERVGTEGTRHLALGTGERPKPEEQSV
jgi:O-antigen ligase